jgi:hypothetical protein
MASLNLMITAKNLLRLINKSKAATHGPDFFRRQAWARSKLC